MARPVDKPGSKYDGMTLSEKAKVQPRNERGQFTLPQANPDNIQPNPVLHQSQRQEVSHTSSCYPSTATFANGPDNPTYNTAVSQYPSQYQPQVFVNPSTYYASTARFANGSENSVYQTAVTPPQPQQQGNSYPTAHTTTNAGGATTSNRPINVTYNKTYIFNGPVIVLTPNSGLSYETTKNTASAM